MSTNLLRNGDFEADWSEEQSHRCMIYPVQEGPYEMERGEVFNPPGWTTFSKHGKPVEHDPGNPVGWAMPEVRQAPRHVDARRVHSGDNGMLLFTFFRIHDCGLLQQVQVQPGTRLRFTAWAHAWSSQLDDALHSEGAGRDPYYAEEGTPGLSGDQTNFTFWAGIDPTGGTNPYAETVVWGKGAHIYNTYYQLPVVETAAQGGTVTVYLRSRVFWPFKHCDAYFDSAVLEAVTQPPQIALEIEPAMPQVDQTIQVTARSTEAYPTTVLSITGPQGETVPATPASVSQPPEGKAWRWVFVPINAGSHAIAFSLPAGSSPLAQTTLMVQPKPQPAPGLPRDQYPRTYVLLPPAADREWVHAIVDSGAWEARRWTIGGSADDAGIGALEDKTVIAVNPSAWPDDLEAFFEQHYPGTHYVPLQASTPAQLRSKLEEMI